jgi:hypothetical protein
MGLGQMMLTIMASVLLGRVILNINQSTLMAGSTKDMAEYRITGTSLGTSLLEQANNLPFDEKTVASDVTTLTALTASTALGKDVGETTVATFDDIDDYNNYEKLDTLTNSAIFKTTVTVQYVYVSSNVITVATSQQWAKKISVSVSSAFLEDTLRFNSIYSYWFFR